MNLQEKTVELLLENKKLKKENRSWTDEKHMKEYNITKIYNSKEELPYEVKTYMFGNDGYTSVDHFNELKKECENLINFPVKSIKCGYNPWDSEGGDTSLTNYIYLDDIAEKYKIETKIILVLKKDHTELVLDPRAYLGGELISFYTPLYIVGRIEAGSDSVFVNNDKLNSYREFSLDEKDQIEEWVKSENKRIAGNVDPNADHNNLANQYSQARINSLRNY